MGFEPLEQEQTGFVPLDSAEPNPPLKDRIYKKANALFREGSATDDFAGQPSASESDLDAALSILRNAELDQNAKRQGGISNSDVRIVDGLTGVLEMGARQGYAGIGRTEAGLIKALGDVLGSDTLSGIADEQMSYADKIERGAQMRDSKVEGFSPDSIAQDVPKAAASAIGSTIQTAPNLALAAVAPELVLPSIFATTYTQEYGKGRQDGLPPIGSALRSIPQAGFEVAGEKLGGMDKLAAGLAKAARGHGATELGSAMLTSGIKETPGELFTTTGQFLTDKLPGVGTNQEAGLDEYAKQMKDTALTTLLQSAGMSVGGHVLNKIAGQQPVEQQGETAPEQGVNYEKVIESLQRAEQVATASREQGFQPLQEDSQVAVEASNQKEVTPMAQPQEAATTSPPGQVAPPIQTATQAIAPEAQQTIQVAPAEVVAANTPNELPTPLSEKTTQKTKPKPKKKAGVYTLLTTIRNMGGLANASKSDVAGDRMAPGGYNQLFKKDSKHTIEGLAGKGELDDFLPYELRFSTKDGSGEVADMQDAVDWIKDKIRSGERVIPYDAQMELDQKALEEQYQEKLTDVYSEEFDYDEINAAIQRAADEEREGTQAAYVADSINTNGSAERSAGAEAGAGGFQLTSEGKAEPSLTTEQQAEADNQALLKRQVETEAVRNAGLQAQTQPKEEGTTSQASMFTADGRATVAADKTESMFSQSGKKNATPQTIESITKATARLRNGWSGFRKVSIVQSVKEIPNDVYLRALRALQPINQTTEGIYDPNTNIVYLIADNIASPERAVWVAAHEVVGHGGIRMLDKSVAEHVGRLAKNGFIEKLAQAIAKDRGDPFNKSIHVQEAIAELAAAHVTGDANVIFDRYGVKVPAAIQDGIMGVIARIVQAVRIFMAKVLSKPVSEVSDSEVISLIRQMKDAADGVEQSDVMGSGRAVMASMSQDSRDNQGQTPAFPDTAKGKALEFLWKLTANDWMFRMPTSFKKDMVGIANDMKPGKFNVRELPTDTVPEEAARKWQVKFNVEEDGKQVEKTAYITEDHDKQIFIDVSTLKQGQRGNEIYQIAAAYAHNTGRVFVPDPSGVSTIAVSRRVENLLSSALRYGTTKHLLPSDITGLDWIEGDDLHNIEQMLDATIRHTSENVALLDQVEYDFHTDKFILIGDENETRSNTDKVEFTASDFRRAAERSFAGRDARGTGAEGVGNTTLQRAVFARSVLRQTSSGQGRRVLAEAYSAIQQRETPVAALEGLYYSNAPEAYKAVAKLPRDFDILAKVLPKHIPLVYDRDELGNIRSDFLGSRRLKDFLHASFLRPMAVRTGMAQANKELAKLMRSQKAAVDKAMRVASDVIDSTKGMTEEESALISRIVTEEMQPGDVPPAHAMKIAAVVERAMTEQGQEAVELQMLSKEAYEKWKGKYLPRFYMRYLDPEIKGIWQRTFKASPISGFRSGSLKGRGKRQIVTVQELPEWEALGWEVADKAWKKNKQGQLGLTVEGKAMPNTDTVAIWKDYTPDERRDMGEVQDFRLRFVMGYLSMQRDIAIGRLYRQIAANPDWTRRTPSEGYSYIPITEIPDTGGLNRYGMLAGLYVKDEILSHISQYENSDNEFQRYYKTALSKWKEGKTVLNPVTHMNNFVSNVTMAHFAGVSYWDGEKYFFALKDLIQNAPMMREAEDAGLFTGDFSHAEIMKAMPEEVRNLVNRETDSTAVKTGRFIWKLASLGLNEKMANAYHWGDVIFKYAIYRDARSKGMSPEDSVYHAAKFIFNYDDLPSTARGIRDYALPFFAYTYKVIPALASTAIEYPWRFAAPAVIISSINALSYAALAGDSGDDDWWLRAIMSNTMTPLLNAYSMGFYGDDEPKTPGQELEQEERKNLAEWDKGASAMGTQKTIRLGTDETTGLPVFINVYRFIPGGDIQDVQNEKGGIGIPAPFMPSNPVLNAFSALVDNKNWDGKEMFDANDTGSEKAIKTADYLYKLAFPTIAPGGAHYDRIMNATAKFSDTTIEVAHPLKDYTGIGKDGLPIQPKYAAMQTIGIKARPVDLEKSAEMNQVGDNAKLKSIKIELRSAARLLDKGAISQREYDRIIAEGEAKIDALSVEE